MALPAFKPAEPPVEERIARLEAHVEHIQSDVTELKVKVDRNTDALMQLTVQTERAFAAQAERTNARFAEQADRMNAGFERMTAALAEQSASSSAALAKQSASGSAALAEQSASMNAALAEQSASMNAALAKQSATTNAAIAELRLSTEKGFSRMMRWGLLLYVGLAATLLSVMAHGFRWF